MSVFSYEMWSISLSGNADQVPTTDILPFTDLSLFLPKKIFKLKIYLLIFFSLGVFSSWMFQLLKGDPSMSGLQIKQTRAPIILDLEGGGEVISLHSIREKLKLISPRYLCNIDRSEGLVFIGSCKNWRKSTFNNEEHGKEIWKDWFVMRSTLNRKPSDLTSWKNSQRSWKIVQMPLASLLWQRQGWIYILNIIALSEPAERMTMYINNN